jgi:hypothetical protein
MGSIGFEIEVAIRTKFNTSRLDVAPVEPLVQ